VRITREGASHLVVRYLYMNILSMSDRNRDQTTNTETRDEPGSLNKEKGGCSSKVGRTHCDCGQAN
jgi:hypothetical protein